jgi:hypothetical protein
MAKDKHAGMAESGGGVMKALLIIMLALLIAEAGRYHKSCYLCSCGNQNEGGQAMNVHEVSQTAAEIQRLFPDSRANPDIRRNEIIAILEKHNADLEAAMRRVKYEIVAYRVILDKKMSEPYPDQYWIGQYEVIQDIEKAIAGPGVKDE